jgi:uncharacterized membrane protein YheB (UPF0754 family)
MELWILVPLNIAIAAAIGGITNYLAIRMLFHPRHEIRIGSWRVPFTPGLIPKRKDEIAAALGDVVAEYLVTPAGIREWLQKPEFREKLEMTMAGWVEAWSASPMTWKEVLARYSDQAQVEEGLSRLAERLKSILTDSTEWVWTEKGIGDTAIQQLVPGWPQWSRGALPMRAAGMIAESLKQELASPDGYRTLHSMAKRLIDQAGGFLGVMAVIFVDEDKLVQKLRPLLIAQLDSPALRQTIASLLERKLDELGQIPVREALTWVSGADEPLEWLKEKLAGAPLEAWLHRIGDLPVSALAAPFRGSILAALPSLTGWLLRFAEQRIEPVIKTLQLPSLVEEQVRRFPTEQLERLLLDISGREFRAITWLGALLGGLIGLMQVLLMQLYR